MRDLTAADVLHEVLVTPRRAFTRVPGMRVVERPGWNQIVTPSFTQGGLNEVSYCGLPADEADAAIDAAIAEYARLGLGWRFSVGPDARPHDLGDRLLARGFVRHETRGMARDVSALNDAAGDDGAADARVTIARVDETLLDAFTAAMAEGWGIDRAPLDDYHAALLREPERSAMFLASVDGEPAATASYIAFERSAYLVGGLVLPRFQRRGLYRRLVAARIDEVRARGIPLVTTHAMAETSAPILARLGFRDVCALGMYVKPRA